MSYLNDYRDTNRPKPEKSPRRFPFREVLFILTIFSMPIAVGMGGSSGAGRAGTPNQASLFLFFVLPASVVISLVYYFLSGRD